MGRDRDEGDGDQRSPEIALESARRVYDMRVRRLESIDDKAMRTARTAVLILGFIAAGLTSIGPTTIASTPLLPFVAGSIGSICISASAFLCVGVYTVTEYPNEISEGDLDTIPRPTEEFWYENVMHRLEFALSAIGAEIDKNKQYFEIAQLLLLTGAFLLVYATGVTVISGAFGIPVDVQTGAVLLPAAALALLRAVQIRRFS
ncbi:hypothetical protein [Haloarcula marismortui]|uniref:Uncharacterized protein n=1 Tax=Haloarcula marismortui ATCC 33800 TaxID=662476 RepID=M0JGC2_9EURY|nr:hypothetical protein [Haloarcula sinaiiensis]EMA08172.1 hypothetical protein C436_20603 [Haloarcula sinaiiensis ATCC 33800]QUJ73998.1 hypothetical protein KDQ40_18690 [Haloarcula sinaiiensis ATCC 33800]